ncbi:hypothetical protein [Gottfriedia acidiceleris]|uniref:hypothetical protein n=1 Tax=Gottfriedia acidiceleris TaxID=371036 RepID=UPI000B43E2E3|nr:hypothetical protein [Gottfriedia acidiceleris]
MKKLNFHGATNIEIKEKKLSLMTRLHIKNLLTHQGELFINDDGIEFKGWKTINWQDIIDLRLENDKVVSSKLFTTQSRLFFLQSAKPIKLRLINNEVIYFYVNWNFATGLSDNNFILNLIKEKNLLSL